MNEREQGILQRVSKLVKQLDGEVDLLRRDSEAPNPAQQSVVAQDLARRANVAEFAVRLVGAWEGNTFGWHGAPGQSAFGILGFEGDLAGRLRAFDRQRGGDGIMDAIAPETQITFASRYFHQIDANSCAPRGIDSLAGRVMAFDMAVNNGKFHPFFAETDRDLGLSQAKPPGYHGYAKSAIARADQASYLADVALKRIEMRRHLFGRFPGLEDRYRWWHEQIQSGFSDPLHIEPRAMAIPLPRQPAAPSGIRWGSPLNPQARACIAPGWIVSQAYAAIFPDHPLVPKWMWGLAHSGLDFNTLPDDYGLPVYAAAAGTVSCAKDLGGTWRNVVVLEHDGDVLSRYGHLSRMTVGEGQRVERGAMIGCVGDAGGALPSHLHFDICVSGILRRRPGFNSAFASGADLAKHFADPVSWINERGHWL